MHWLKHILVGLLISVVSTASVGCAKSPAIPATTDLNVTPTPNAAFDDIRISIRSPTAPIDAAVLVPMRPEHKIFHVMKDDEPFIVSIAPVDRDEDRRTVEMGPRTRLHVALTASGPTVDAAEDRRLDLVTRFSPSQPILPHALAPGATRTVTCDATIFDIDRPTGSPRSHGTATFRFTHDAIVVLKTSAGTYECARLWAHVVGDFGLVQSESMMCLYYAPGVGMVAQDTRERTVFMGLLPLVESRRMVLKTIEPVDPP